MRRLSFPVLCMRRPVHSARLQLEDRSWMLGFAMESSSLLLYAAALALAPLALVQTIAAGGIGVLAFASARLARRRLSIYELVGVLISVFGLVALGLSLAAGGGKDGRGSTTSILLWLGATARVAIVLVLLGRKVIGVAVADGMAPRRSSRSATSRRSWPPGAAFVSASW